MEFIGQPFDEDVDLDEIEAVERKQPEVKPTSIAADDALRSAVLEFKNAHPIRISMSAACCFLIRKGLEAVKKEAARG